MKKEVYTYIFINCFNCIDRISWNIYYESRKTKTSGSV